jgi:hypothetical protein
LALTPFTEIARLIPLSCNKVAPLAFVGGDARRETR